jgi:hypothetical protein
MAWRCPRGAALDQGSRADLLQARGLKGNPDIVVLSRRFKNENRSLLLDAADCEELMADVAERMDYGNCRRRHAALGNQVPLLRGVRTGRRMSR